MTSASVTVDGLRAGVLYGVVAYLHFEDTRIECRSRMLALVEYIEEIVNCVCYKENIVKRSFKHTYQKSQEFRDVIKEFL